VPISPLRAEPLHRSEMISQLLFGEACDILEIKEDWFRISVVHDGYEGYCSENQFMHVREEPGTGRLTGDWINEVTVDGKPMRIPFGALIPTIGGISFNGREWDVSSTGKNDKRLFEAAFMFINTPYLWGGRSVFGADCSGFVQTAFRYINIALPRDAAHQAERGEVVGLLQEARAGDLAFVDDPEGDIIHVGILLNGASIIHAYGKVRVDGIDNEGIVNTETGNRTHRLRIIKRLF